MGEVRESICILAGTWRAGRGVSLLWGLEVRGKLRKEGRSGGVLLALGNYPLSRKGFTSKTGNRCIFLLLYK